MTLRAETNYASYQGKPVKFITFVARLPEETSAGNNRLFSVALPYCPLALRKGGQFSE